MSCDVRAFLNQKISSLSKNLEKAVHDMKVQDRNVDLLQENVKILQKELSQKKWTVFCIDSV